MVHTLTDPAPYGPIAQASRCAMGATPSMSWYKRNVANATNSY